MKLIALILSVLIVINGTSSKSVKEKNFELVKNYFEALDEIYETDPSIEYPIIVEEVGSVSQEDEAGSHHIGSSVYCTSRELGKTGHLIRQSPTTHLSQD